jgi:hypothetical protein
VVHAAPAGRQRLTGRDGQLDHLPWPRLEPPGHTGTVTVFDVAAAGTMAGSVAGHAEAVRRWATAVWRAWAPRHAAVAALTDRLLG